MPRVPKLKVLIVEDDPLNSELYRIWLAGIKNPSFESVLVFSLSTARAALASTRFDAILLDRALGDGDGIELLRSIRADVDMRDMPVLIISGRKADREVITGLNRGADDYLAKPCTAEMFSAHLLAVLRRTRAAETKPLLAGPGFQIDPVDGRLFVAGRVEHLEPKEAELLAIFLRRPGVVHTAAYLHETVWGEKEVPRNTLETRISNLRRKLGARSSCLETIRGCGYRLLP